MTHNSSRLRVSFPAWVTCIMTRSITQSQTRHSASPPPVSSPPPHASSHSLSASLSLLKLLTSHLCPCRRLWLSPPLLPPLIGCMVMSWRAPANEGPPLLKLLNSYLCPCPCLWISPLALASTAPRLIGCMVMSWRRAPANEGPSPCPRYRAYCAPSSWRLPFSQGFARFQYPPTYTGSRTLGL